MLLSGAPDGLSAQGWSTAAIGVLMAVWWATEAVPIAITALLPLVVFPLFGVASIQETAAPYSNKVIYLFLGGFIVAFAMQRWNLHRRIALSVLQHAGGDGRSLVGGFMLSSALISMWVMNTSTTMMLLPIAVSIITVIHKTVGSLDAKGREDFQFSLLLGVAYGATIGGMATLVGTAPNASRQHSGNGGAVFEQGHLPFSRRFYRGVRYAALEPASTHRFECSSACRRRWTFAGGRLHALQCPYFDVGHEHIHNDDAATDRRFHHHGHTQDRWQPRRERPGRLSILFASWCRLRRHNRWHGDSRRHGAERDACRFYV